jgi:hypothetical protein
MLHRLPEGGSNHERKQKTDDQDAQHILRSAAER